jgi:hypothetical protein
MAHVWIESDKVLLRRAVRLVDDIATGESTEHRALLTIEDRLGLSPKARRALGWEVVAGEDVLAKEVPQNVVHVDPRLRAV